MVKEIETIRRACRFIEEESNEFVIRLTTSISQEDDIFQVAFMSESNIPYELHEDGSILKLENGNWRNIGEV